MANNILESLLEFKEKGIIDDKQFNDMKFEIHKEEAVTRRRTLKLANLVLGLTVILLISVSVLITFLDPYLVSNEIKIYASIAFMLSSIFLLYGAISRKEYFMQELLTMFNVFAIVCLITSVNQILEFRYRLPENLFFAMLAMLPIFAITETYLTLFAVSIMFIFGEQIVLNIAILPVSNNFYLALLCGAYIVLLLYKYLKAWRSREYSAVQSEYISRNLQGKLVEILMGLYLCKIMFTMENGVNPIFIYLVFIALLLRRSSYFNNERMFSGNYDNAIFIVLSLMYLVIEPVDDIKIYIISYHTIYYLIFFLLNERGMLEALPKTYSIKQHFYINLIFFSYMIIPLDTLRNNWYILTMAIGLFNVIIARRTRVPANIFFGFGLMAFTIIETGVRALTYESAINLMILGIAIIISNFNNFRQGVRDFGKDEEV